MKRLFKKVALGGTFDSFHIGHEKLLDSAFSIADKVLIGVTSDSFAKQLRKIHEIASFKERVNYVKEYLTKKWPNRNYEIVKLEDPYGPTITDMELEALVVSEETVNGGIRINELRCKNNLPPITILVVDMVLAEDGLPISSTRIRQGIINREGKLMKVTKLIESIIY
ncbi:MAG: phosphopantetheine adenylyltransferase [Candidatus Asgardarchaeia archaeon]